MSKFIYFPSFSAGEYGDQLRKNKRLRSGLTCRFYADDFPEQFKHNEVLITAGVHFKKDNYRDMLGLSSKNLVLPV